MPGRRKTVWRGLLQWPPLNPILEDGKCTLPIIIPDHDAGRVINVELTRTQAREIGMTLWQWGNE